MYLHLKTLNLNKYSINKINIFKSNLYKNSKDVVSVLNRLLKKDIIVWTGTTKKDYLGKYIIK